MVLLLSALLVPLFLHVTSAQESHTTLTTTATESATTLTHTLTTSTSTTIAPTATPSADQSWTDNSTFKATCIDTTNMYRAQHGAPAIVWNDSLALWATRWTSQCLWAHSGLDFGENIAEGFADVASAVDGWGNERRWFDFQHPHFTEETGHFSQLVWKNSTSVGCGRMFCSTDGRRNNRVVARNKPVKAAGWFLACEYWPPGNVDGQFRENVGIQISNGDTKHGLIGGGGASDDGVIGSNTAMSFSARGSAVFASFVVAMALAMS